MTSVAPPGAPPPTGSPPARPAPAGEPRAQRVQRRVGLPNGRTVVGGLLMALAAIAAFALSTAGDDGDAVEVVVASRDLRAGDVITDGDLRLVPIDIDGSVGGLFGSIDAATGRTVVAPTDEGEFLLASSTTEADDGTADGFEMTLAVSPERSPGGLAAGEPVDVFATWNSGVTQLIAVDATVLDVDESGDDLIGGSELRIRLRLDDLSQVEAVVHAHAAADVTLVRTPAEGSRPIGREYRPDDPVSQPDGDETGEDADGG